MLMYMLSPSLPTLTVSVVGVHAAIRTGLFTPDKAFEVVVRKRIVSLKAPTDLVVRLVTEEVLKICQAGFAQVTAPLLGSSSLGKQSIAPACHVSAFEKHRLDCQHTTNWFPVLHFFSNLTLHASHPLFFLSLPAC